MSRMKDNVHALYDGNRDNVVCKAVNTECLLFSSLIIVKQLSEWLWTFRTNAQFLPTSLLPIAIRF